MNRYAAVPIDDVKAAVVVLCELTRECEPNPGRPPWATAADAARLVEVLVDAVDAAELDVPTERGDRG